MDYTPEVVGSKPTTGIPTFFFTTFSFTPSLVLKKIFVFIHYATLRSLTHSLTTFVRLVRLVRLVRSLHFD